MQGSQIIRAELDLAAAIDHGAIFSTEGSASAISKAARSWLTERIQDYKNIWAEGSAIAISEPACVLGISIKVMNHLREF